MLLRSLWFIDAGNLYLAKKNGDTWGYSLKVKPKRSINQETIVFLVHKQGGLLVVLNKDELVYVSQQSFEEISEETESY